jgi:glycosyltransferase involved in cell wall biosynthesis
MNLGLPAIVSSHVGCGPDLILAGKTGWIFNAGDSGDLKATLAEVLADPARLKTMGQRAQTHIANFSYERATESFIAVIRKIRWRS